MAKSPPDGYTVINAVNTIMVVNPFLYSKVGYDPQRDFDAVSMMVKISEVLVVHPFAGRQDGRSARRAGQSAPEADHLRERR